MLRPLASVYTTSGTDKNLFGFMPVDLFGCRLERKYRHCDSSMRNYRGFLSSGERGGALCDKSHQLQLLCFLCGFTFFVSLWILSFSKMWHVLWSSSRILSPLFLETFDHFVDGSGF
jgi:hypothetical protein